MSGYSKLQWTVFWILIGQKLGQFNIFHPATQELDILCDVGRWTEIAVLLLTGLAVEDKQEMQLRYILASHSTRAGPISQQFL